MPASAYALVNPSGCFSTMVTQGSFGTALKSPVMMTGWCDITPRLVQKVLSDERRCSICRSRLGTPEGPLSLSRCVVTTTTSDGAPTLKILRNSRCNDRSSGAQGRSNRCTVPITQANFGLSCHCNEGPCTEDGRTPCRCASASHSRRFLYSKQPVNVICPTIRASLLPHASSPPSGLSRISSGTACAISRCGSAYSRVSIVCLPERSPST
mmetsp:Transcript_28865/g.66707  ORF Transcript_28865/g.66707 Transcript_28865/m.66707 type:complete len:211 (+) Transcript_28865:445-1077(+)